jgi:enoyl-CoA hydratase/carnithine racemase
VRIDVAKELTMTGRVLSGTEALGLGLVTRLADTPLEAAAALASEIAARSPDAVAAAKFLLQEGWQATEEEALAAERRWQRRVIGRENQRIAIRRNLARDAPGDPPPFRPRRVGS